MSGLDGFFPLDGLDLLQGVVLGSHLTFFLLIQTPGWVKFLR